MLRLVVFARVDVTLVVKIFAKFVSLVDEIDVGGVFEFPSIGSRVANEALEAVLMTSTLIVTSMAAMMNLTSDLFAFDRS